MFRRATSLVGLDIGSTAIKAVELKGTARAFHVAAYGSEPLPPDSIADGAIVDADAVAEAIRRVLDTAGIRNREVAASLSGSAVIVKRITVPAMTEAELAGTIHWEAEQHIPFDLDDVNLDYQSLGAADPSADTMDVLLVAAKKERIADYTRVISQAGRVAIVLDVDAFALHNAYEVNYGAEPGAVVVLLDAGASATTVSILSGDQSFLTREISIGGRAHAEALQREMSLPAAAAEQLRRGVSVPGATLEEARPVVRAVTESVMLEIEKTFDFFTATAASNPIDRIVVTGGASRAEGFTEALAERFNTAVEVMDPFREITFDARRLAADAADARAVAAVAVGLALRRAGDW